MISLKKLFAITACVTTFGLGVEFVSNLDNVSSVKAASVWHKGSPKALRGKWKYDLHTGLGGGWGQFYIYKNRMQSTTQGDPTVDMINVRYKYNGNGIYIIKSKGTSMLFAKDGQTEPGTITVTHKLKLINSKNMVEYRNKHIWTWHK